MLAPLREAGEKLWLAAIPLVVSKSVESDADCDSPVERSDRPRRPGRAILAAFCGTALQIPAETRRTGLWGRAMDKIRRKFGESSKTYRILKKRL